ncbi:MAG: hypothetical protein EU536_05040, partial [Promethearchaeota archaeon]
QDLMKDYQASLKKIVINASEVIPEKARILVYSFSTTVFETIKFQKSLGKSLEIFITEARPNNEGLVGAQQFSKIFPTTLLIDAAIGYLLKDANINLVLLGADSFTTSELVHKIGTLPLAITAHNFQIPIYALTHSLKYYHGTASNYPLPIESKPRSEITDLELENLTVRNFYFDHTPLRFLTSMITDKGLFDCSLNQFPEAEKIPVRQLDLLYQSLKGKSN